MSDAKRLVLDANILLRAVSGQGTRDMLGTYGDYVNFYSPDVCFDDARRYIPIIAARRKLNPAAGFLALEELARVVEKIDFSSYEEYEAEARRRISRDVSDWPIVATALLLNCPVWTEDRDFFGSGLATWTTNNVEIYLKAS